MSTKNGNNKKVVKDLEKYDIPLPEDLTDKEIKNLMIKLSPIVSKAVIAANAVYDYNDMAMLTGLQVSRFSNLKNYKNYKDNYLSEWVLTKLIGGRLVKVDMLKEAEDLTDREKEFLENMKVHEDVDTHHLNGECRKRGLNMLEIVRQYLDEFDKRK